MSILIFIIELTQNKLKIIKLNFKKQKIHEWKTNKSQYLFIFLYYLTKSQRKITWTLMPLYY